MNVRDTIRINLIYTIQCLVHVVERSSMHMKTLKLRLKACFYSSKMPEKGNKLYCQKVLQIKNRFTFVVNQQYYQSINR